MLVSLSILFSSQVFWQCDFTSKLIDTTGLLMAQPGGGICHKLEFVKHQSVFLVVDKPLPPVLTSTVSTGAAICELLD
jgi:hypothetical protein